PTHDVSLTSYCYCYRAHRDLHSFPTRRSSDLIGYIHYEAPVEEQNFSTLIEFINAMEVREDDEEFKNPVDLMFDALEAENPNHFAVRQYKKYKLAAGDVCSK